MRIRFTHDIFRIERFGGVARYVVELHGGLLAHGHDSRVLAFLHTNGHLRGVPSVAGIDVSRVRPELARQALTKVVDAGLARASLRRRADVVHLTYFRMDPPRVPCLATTVYDMIHERFPETAGPRDISVVAKARSCERADVVFTISETTKTDLLDRLPGLEDRIVVTPLGVRPVTPATGVVLPDRPYVIYVGDRARPYKNFDGLLRELAGVPDVLLVVFGGGPFTVAERQRGHELGIADRVVERTGDDATLAAHLAGAAALVCPSRYEGFGLPLLEAMAAGCPVVAAATGAIPEVVGDAALLVDPGEDGALGAAIELVLHDDEKASQLRARGRVRVEAFDWEHTVTETIKAYEAVT